MSQQVSPATDHRYGIALVCRVWRFSRAAVYRARQASSEGPRERRRGPPGPCSDDELVDRIRSVIAASPFHGEGYRKLWARLRATGIRTSKERVRRLMREHGLRAPYFPKRVHGPSKAHDRTITTERPDEMWGTDATAALTRLEGMAFIFLAVDHCTGECVGAHASASGDRFEALEPIRQGIRHAYGRYDQDVAIGLSLRHDHGSQYTSRQFQEEIRFLGIRDSPAYVGEPECNGVAERFIRTLKEQLLWVETFDTIEELRQALTAFKDRYNAEWLVQRFGHRTPNQIRHDLTQPTALAA